MREQETFNKELERSNELLDLIKKNITLKGAISFQDYMQKCLYTANLGYYTSNRIKFADKGDFTTAPHISYLFGHCIANQIQEILNNLITIKENHKQSEKQELAILEVGAGTGKLALDILKKLQKIECLPDKYYIKEISSELKIVQRETLAHLINDKDFKCEIVWVDKQPCKNFDGIIIANELFDALPVKKILINSIDDIKEYYVKLGLEKKLEFELKPLRCNKTIEIAKKIYSLHNNYNYRNYTTEICPDYQPFLEQISSKLDRGVLLFIDYGYSAAEYYHPDRNTGTLKCYYQHTTNHNPLLMPGLQDISAHVNFSLLALSAINLNLTLAGYISQANFLINNNLAQIAQINTKQAKQIDILNQIQLLTMPQHMGENCKAIAFTRNYTPVISGFNHNSLSHKL